jgi:hypothetical protein
MGKKKIVLIEVDIFAAVLKKYKPESFKVKKGKFEYSAVLNVDDSIYKEVKKDPLLQAKLTDPVSDLYKKSLKNLVKVFEDADKMIKKNPDAIKDAEKMIFSALKDEKKDLNKKAVKNGTKVWEKLQKTKSDYKDYQIAVATEITVAACTVVGGVASAATGTVTAGFGFIVGIWQTFKGVVALAKGIWKAWKSADKQRDVCEKSLASLHKNYDKKSKTIASMNEAGGVFLEFLTGEKFISNIEETIKSFKTYNHKLEGVDLESHKLSRALEDLLKKMSDARKKLKKESDSNASKLEKGIKKVEKEVQKIIPKIVDFQTKVNEGQTYAEEQMVELEKIKNAKKSDFVFYFEKGLIIVDLALGAAASPPDNLKDGLSLFNAVVGEVDKELASQLQ